MINYEKFEYSFASFKTKKPFNYLVIDDFIYDQDMLNNLEKEFPKYNSPDWYVYDNKLENKKTINNWNYFNDYSYKFFSFLSSPIFISKLNSLTGYSLLVDPGLHGGGFHIHGNKGNLNPHLDYSLHPKLMLQRKLNLILFLSKEMKCEYGGHLGFWEHNSELDKPGDLIVEIEPKYNRAVLFDTSQNSWHGFSRPLNVPNNVFRKSLAIYYLVEPDLNNARDNKRALYAPRIDQENDNEVLELIKNRVDENNYKNTYRDNLNKKTKL